MRIAPRVAPGASPAQELKECGKDTVVKVSLINESDLLHWKGHIKGPEGTPYEGGMFTIDITLPADYPFVPPKVMARTPLTRRVAAPRAGADGTDEIRHAHLAPEHKQRERCHLLRHSQK